MIEQADGPSDLPADAKILWRDHARPPRGRPPRLSLDKIVTAAIGLADREGLSALSMQRLAAELDAGTMSLYRYVDTKAALTALMLDTAIGPPEDFSEAGTWRASLEQWGHQNLMVFRQHPWTLPLVTTHRVMGPNETAHFDAALRTISGLGLTVTAMLDTVLLVNGFVRGTAYHFALSGSSTPPESSGARSITAATLDALGQRDRYPALAAVLDAAGTDLPTGHDPLRGFEFGLRRILDGLETYLSHIHSQSNDR